ncbi:MAG: hypothetical protein MZU91_08395 [Desulfosudis oleivorans]|nr:hypothetical protein [Desulfosudis oleivorans]
MTDTRAAAGPLLLPLQGGGREGMGWRRYARTHTQTNPSPTPAPGGLSLGDG